MARTTKSDPQRQTRSAEVAPRILEIVAQGESLLSACRTVGLAHSTFLEACAKDEKLADQYACARLSGADVEFEGMRDLEEKVLRGELDPQAFRVAMDARKWRLARKSPRKYGDRTAVDVTGDMTLTAVSKLSTDEIEAMLAEKLRDLGIEAGDKLALIAASNGDGE